MCVYVYMNKFIKGIYYLIIVKIFFLVEFCVCVCMLGGGGWLLYINYVYRVNNEYK